VEAVGLIDRLWTRERVDTWLPPVSRDNEELQIYLRRQGWLH